MNGTRAAASASNSAIVLPPLILVRSASVRWVGGGEIELPHHGHECVAAGFLQARIAGAFGADRGMAASLIIMGREHQRFVRQGQQHIE